MTLSDEISEILETGGASLIGFADLRSLPASVRHDLPRAVSFAVALTPEITAEIKDGPTQEYHAEYKRINALLGELSLATASLIESRGFRAISSAATDEGIDAATNSTPLPHKTVATLAGLGWIGKCALLVNERFGSAIRLNRVLTDAPLTLGTPVVQSRCGDCRTCVDACPAHAAAGENWIQGRQRDNFFNASVCRRMAREIALRRTGISETFCGVCIAVCPWTQAYVRTIAACEAQEHKT